MNKPPAQQRGFAQKVLRFLAALLIFSLGFFLSKFLYAQKIDLQAYSPAQADLSLAMPYSGTNFSANSILCYGLGRYYLKGNVAATIIDAYRELSEKFPEKMFIYAEMGWQNGGAFYPHKTHRQGTSADFITPVLKAARPAVLPVSITNLFGYNIRLAPDGTYKDYQIDTRAMIEHIMALKQSGIKYGVSVKRVIFDPPLLRLLRQDPVYSNIKDVAFLESKAWFPHDGHYHIDFGVLSR